MRSLNRYDGRSGGSCCVASPCSMGMTADTSNLADRSAAARRPVAAGSATPAKQVARRAAGAVAAAAAREARGQREPADMPAPAPQRAGASARIAAATRTQSRLRSRSALRHDRGSGGASGPADVVPMPPTAARARSRARHAGAAPLAWPSARAARVLFTGGTRGEVAESGTRSSRLARSHAGAVRCARACGARCCRAAPLRHRAARPRRRRGVAAGPRCAFARRAPLLERSAQRAAARHAACVHLRVARRRR